MKKTALILTILFFISLLFGNDCPEKNNIYVLLDRNSSNITFTVRPEDIVTKDNVLVYALKTGINDFTLGIGFVYFGKTLPDMYQHEKYRKPVTFLDSITYYDERYIMETKKIDENLFHWQKLKDTRIFVIDPGTQENDSVMMYEVTVGFDGYEK